MVGRDSPKIGGPRQASLFHADDQVVFTLNEGIAESGFAGPTRKDSKFEIGGGQFRFDMIPVSGQLLPALAPDQIE